MSDQPKKSSHPVLCVLGILLLAVVLVIGGLFVILKTDAVTVDDPAALAARTPMPASQRFVFDAAGETAQIKLDKSDLWFLLLPEMGESFFEDLNRELEGYNLSLTGYGFDIREDGIRIDVEAMFRSLRLPVHVLAELVCDGEGLSLTLTQAKLGPIPLPAEALLNKADVQMDVDWPVVTEIINVGYEQDAVVLTGTLTQDMLSCVQKVCKNDAVGWFSSTHQEIFRTARKADGYKALLPGLQQDPGSVEALYHDLFTLAQVDEYKDFLEATRELPRRFFPGIDFDAWEKENDSIRAKWTFCNVMVDRLVAEVSIDFNNRRFSLRNGKFYLGRSEFDALNYFGGDTALKMEQLFHVLDLDSFRLVLVDAENSDHQKIPVLSRICAGNQPLTKDVARNRAYAVGCVFRGVNGEYFLRYESLEPGAEGAPAIKSFTSVPLSDAEYAVLAQEGKIGVWSDQA